MATLTRSTVSDAHSEMASPRPKARENLKNTPCRNIGIFGFCKYEKDGCAYSHDVLKTKTQGQSGSMPPLERFNVDSPAFTPLQPNSNGVRNTTISPRSANATPFTPKTNNSPMINQIRLKPAVPEWTPEEIPEFVPGGYDSSHTAESENQSSLASGFENYAQYPAIQSLSGTSQTQITNPYLQDPTGGHSGATYYQGAPSFTQPLQYHLYCPLAPYRENLLPFQRATHDFFIPEDLRRDFQRRSEASLQVLPNSAVLPNLDHFHSLVPLDTVNQKNTSIFGYPTWIYKAVSSKDGKIYALRRLEGYRLTNENSIRALQPWKKMNHGVIVTVHDVFTTRAFGDSSLIFVTDYHPCSMTLADHHFQPAGMGKSTDRFGNAARAQNSQQVPEPILWGYIVQLATALRTIHAAGLAAQIMHPSKVILTSKNRIRLSACGIQDVVKFNPSQAIVQRTFKQEQQDDLIQLGRLILCLAVGSPAAYITPHKALESLSRTYTERLRDCISWLLSPAQEESKDIDILLSEIVGQVATTLDAFHHAEDNLVSTIATTLENGRLVRLLLKINLVLERPEYEHNPMWSETGERYYIKLFRDYVFHAVDASGRPLTDLAHILGCLNRLDAGSSDTIQLTSRDGETAFLVTYKDIKRAIQGAFNDIDGNGALGVIAKGRK